MAAKKQEKKKTTGPSNAGATLLPAEPEPTLILAVKPIPAPLFRQNLRSFLGQSRWRKLRQSLLPQDCRKCQTCGHLVENSSKLNAHEEWSFDMTVDPVKARVINIKFVCWHCHACEHFMHTIALAREGVIGEDALRGVIQHFCKVNGVDELHFDQHLIKAKKEWQQMSRLEFSVDYGKYTGA